MAALVFDLDGTLIDSAPDIRAAVNRMLEDEGRAPLDLPTVISFIGNGLPRLVARAMQARDCPPEDHDRLTRATLAYYQAAPATLSRPYPGIHAALEALRSAGHRLGICTNKPEAPARAILADFDMAALFDVVVGGDTLAVRKPDPAPLIHAVEAMSGPPVFVGDSEIDAETAARARIPFVLFTEGYRKVPVDTLPHAALYSAASDLPGAIAALGIAGPARS